MTATEPTPDEQVVDVRAVLVDELMKQNRKAMNMPRHWVDRRAGVHAIMDDLVDQILELDHARLR
jgi:hypothetical protein